MEEKRPDPDQLLAQINIEEAEAKRGRLKIFFGASAGVGKTYAMLSAARASKTQGIDVIIGVIETHGRAETEALVSGFDKLAPKQVTYKDHTLTEFDIDSALSRRPELILVGELAHSNVTGSRHPKRWQDVEEWLDSGIDVWSTMNVQHIESLNDIVGGITGVRVWETVPDRVFDTADEVVIVDLPPDGLLQRLKEGKVYLPQQAERAVRNFFRKGNLIALRELALRRTADRVDDDMLQFCRRAAVQSVWNTRDSLLACVGPGEHGEKTVRSTARLATRPIGPSTRGKRRTTVPTLFRQARRYTCRYQRQCGCAVCWQFSLAMPLDGLFRSSGACSTPVHHCWPSRWKEFTMSMSRKQRLCRWSRSACATRSSQPSRTTFAHLSRRWLA